MTEPRTELSGIASLLSLEVDYVAEWQFYLAQFNSNYAYCLAQLFGDDGPNIMLNYEGGYYNLQTYASHHVSFAGDMMDNLNKWVTWSYKFKISPVNGYVIVFRNGIEMARMVGNTARGNYIYFKLGMYSQNHPQDTV